jgi:L-fuculose-phosphate aldolase
MLPQLESLSAKEVKEAIVDAAKIMRHLGLSPGRSGNISVRWENGMLITASGVPPEAMMAAADVVFVDGDGRCEQGAKLPSTEWHFHRAIYLARPAIGSVVHCHSRFATALACLNKSIPAFHYMVAKAGGADIPLAPYATYGTPELAAHVCASLKERNACLLANHGQVAAGETLQNALELAEEVESLAAQYVAALSLGQPVLLSPEEMRRVALKFKDYGKQPKPESQRNKVGF